MATGFLWTNGAVFSTSPVDRTSEHIDEPEPLLDCNVIIAPLMGADFYLKIVPFGAVPVLTWLAYQFPGIGSTIFKFLEPATQVIK